MNRINPDILPVTLSPGAVTPTRAHDTDAGLDLYAYGSYSIPGGAAVLVDTGVTPAIPQGHVGLLFARSSLYSKFKGARLANGVGVIDSSYRGTIMANIEAGGKRVTINDGDRIVQLVILPIATPAVQVVDRLDTTERGAAGFGSTGHKTKLSA